MATVEQLYKDFGVLADAKEKASEHEQEYLSILSAVQGGPSEKRLASQFIARFFKYFPKQAEKAIDAQLDLCEDDDISIRKQAIKDLPALCKDNPEYVTRIADALAQLLQSDDLSELSLVQTSLLNLLRRDPKGSLTGLFTQIVNGEELVRERCIKFMSSKMNVSETTFTKEVEDFLVEESKKVLEDVTGDEFVAIMTILSKLKTTSTVQGRQQLVEVVAEQADLQSTFDHTDPDCVDRLVQCVRQALPFFSKNVHSTKFAAYICDNVLSVLAEVSTSEVTAVAGSDSSTSSDIQLDILRLLAEMSPYIGDVENTQMTEKVYAKLLECMPLPQPAENGENITPSEEPKLQFSNVECLMYTFHQMARKCPEFLTGENNADRLKDFRIRLQYFARGLQIYIKQLRLALQGKSSDALKTEENKIKVIALRITSNINTLIKDLFHNPPSYKNVVNLSWKPLTKTSPGQTTGTASVGEKRPGITPITFESDGTKKVAKQDRSLYAPPTGKFSEKAGRFASGNRGRGRGGRGQRWRGQGW